ASRGRRGRHSGKRPPPRELPSPRQTFRRTAVDNSTAVDISVEQCVQQLTKGRFLFVIMAFDPPPSGAIFAHLKRIIAEEYGVLCLRADEIPLPGHDLLGKVHTLIDRADFVLAEVSQRQPGVYSPNVFYEIGYARARGKPPLLVAQE